MNFQNRTCGLIIALLLFTAATASFGASVVVIPDSSVLAPGQGIQFHAQLFDDSGRLVRLPQESYHWSVEPENLGFISEDGFFIAARQAGQGKIYAKIEWNGSRQIGEADMKVGRIPALPIQVKIEPQFKIVPPGESVQYKVVVTTSFGYQIEIQNVQWEVRPSALGTIDKNGLFVAGKEMIAGVVIAKVEANQLSYSEQATVIVSPKPTAAISGKVKDETSGAGLAGAVVAAYRVDRVRWSKRTLTDADGNYTLGRLLPGKYVVHVSAQNYIPEWYDNVRHYDEASVVEVAEDATQSGIDFSLGKGASISGQVSLNTQDTPIEGVHVVAYSILTPRWKHHTLTNANGEYLVEGLISGEYKVMATLEGYFPEWYQEKAREADANLVKVVEPETTPDINFTLGTSTAILGTVTDVKTGEPIADAEVYAKFMNLGQNPLSVNKTRTDADGNYTLEVARAGKYIVGAIARGYKAQIYQNAYSLVDADPVEVKLDAHTEDIDFKLVGLGGITGRVISESTGEPIPGAVIQAFPEVWHITAAYWPIYHARSDSEGYYQLENMETGKYLVKATANDYLPEIYEDAETISEATYVEVKDSTTVADIDFDLISGGVITGIIATAEDSTPIPQAMIWVKMVHADENDGTFQNFANHTLSGRDGKFTIKGLPKGEYVVWAKASGYESRFYNNVKTLVEATNVAVTPPGIVEHIDFYLPALERKEGVIAGRVVGERVDSTGSVEKVMIEGAWVLAMPVNNLTRGNVPIWTVTNEAGEYNLTHLRPGKYVVATWAEGYIGEFYDNVRTWRAATRIEVDTNTVVENIDFTLNAVPEGAYTIAGKISDGSGNPVDHAMIYAMNDNDVTGFAMSDAEGNYALDKLVPGNYKIQVSRVEFEDACYGGSSIESATEVPVGDGQIATETNVQLTSTSSAVEPLPAETELPTFYELARNYPNPFNPTTQISYQLPVDAKVTLSVFNLLGQRVRTLVDQNQAAGSYTLQWDGKDSFGNVLPSGIYFYQMEASGKNGANFNQIIKMSLVK